MEIITSFAGVLAVLCLGIISPGPSFVLIARTSAAVSRNDGLAAAIGMGLGGAVFAIIALLGLHAVLAQKPMLYTLLQVAGGLYLVYLASLIWRYANQPLTLSNGTDSQPSNLVRSFKLGFITQVSNPKAAIFYASIFAGLLPEHASLAAKCVVIPIIFALEAGWYAAVAMVLSAPGPSRAYLKRKKHLDRLAGTVIGLLGIKLISSLGVLFTQ